MLEGLKHQSIKDDSKVCNIHRINFKELISRVPLHQATRRLYRYLNWKRNSLLQTCGVRNWPSWLCCRKVGHCQKFRNSLEWLDVYIIAHQAKSYRYEKGYAIDPKMLRWKKFANWCQEFANWCPGKKIVSYFLFVYHEWITTAFPHFYTCHSPWCLLQLNMCCANLLDMIVWPD